MTRCGSSILSVLLLASAAPGPPSSWAQSTGAQTGALAAAPSKPCSTPEHRQLDFWIGNWEVRDAKGKRLGASRVESILDGCVIQERWSGQEGHTGMSFDLYTETDGKWHYNWVDDHGHLLFLVGGMGRDRLVVSDEAPAKRPGQTELHRLSWERVPPNRVRQVYERSGDGGKTWTATFDGIYYPRGEAPPASQ